MSVLRKVLIGGAVLALVGAGVATYLWREATALPEWYEAPENDTVAEPTVEPSAAPRALRGEKPDPPAIVWTPVVGPPEPPDAPSKPASDSRSGAKEVRNFHLRSTAKNPALRKAVRASRATYEDGVLEAGLVINLSKIPRESLSANDRATFDRAQRAFPTLGKRDVYVGLRDKTVTRDGFLQLGSSTKVVVGDLEYSLSSVASRLGLDAGSVRRQINRELRRLKVRDPDASGDAEP